MFLFLLTPPNDFGCFGRSLIFSVDTKGIIISTIIILGAIVGFHGGRALQKEAIYLYLVVCIFHVISLVSQF